MKNIYSLNVDLVNFSNKVIENIKNAQSNTAYVIQQDVKYFAPDDKGIYKQSIQLGETTYDGSTIKTSVYTDATVSAKSNGNTYNLGMLLETGTDPHAIPNAWGKGYTYGYTGPDGRYHKGTMDPDWHPGSIPQPHFLPALNRNIALYKNNIKKAVKEAK